MAMRLRNWGDGWVAVCAAEHGARPGDIYLDDAHDHAIRVKLMADWKSEGFMFDSELPVDATTPTDKAQAEAGIRALAGELSKQEIRVCGCRIEELSREALVDGMRIAWDMLEQERKFHMTGGPVVLTEP